MKNGNKVYTYYPTIKNNLFRTAGSSVPSNIMTLSYLNFVDNT